MMKRSTAIYLLLILCIICTLTYPASAAANDDDDDPSRDPDVLRLNKDNFDKYVQAEEVMAVAFVAPWCGFCKKLKPEWQKAAAVLKQDTPAIPLARVDATKESELASKYKVSGYPTLILFRNGKQYEYKGAREADGIVSYMRKQVGPAAKNVQSLQDIQTLIHQEEYTIIGFFPTDKTSALHASFLLNANALRDHYRFAKVVAQPDIAAHFNLPTDVDTIVAFKKFDDLQTIYQGTSHTKALESFITENSFPLIGNYSKPVVEKYMARNLPILKLFVKLDIASNPKQYNYFLNRLRPAAQTYRSQVLTVIADGTDEALSGELTELGVQKEQLPKLVLHDFPNRKKYHFTQALKAPEVSSFVQAFLNKELTSYVKSQPVPTSDDENVKIVVGSTFNQIVNDPTKDVLIFFSAQWCGHCQALAPKYRELATKVRNAENLVIAKIDAPSNDYPTEFSVSGYPTIYFVPARANAKPILFEGEREVNNMLDFIKKYAVNPVTLKKKKLNKKDDL